MRPWRYFSGPAVVIAFVLFMAMAVTWGIKTDDVIFLPAPAEAIDPHIAVEGHPLQPHRGSLYITFVLEEAQPNILVDFYHRHFDPAASIYSYKDIYGSPPTRQQQQQQQQQSVVEMRDSKTSAEIAAFDALGYHNIATEQVVVDSILKGSKAVGKLEAGDVILAANGRTVRSHDDLVQTVQALSPGAPVTLTVDRNDHHVRVTIPTIRGASTGKAMIGIATRIIIDAHPPYKVTIDSRDQSGNAIGGPSAGLMFALAIINRLSPHDLTHGYKIAGTGAIEPNGVVDPIGGVKQKVIGAREAGAHYFFVPAYCDPNVCNYKEAKPYAQGITLVPVRTLDDALAFLRKLH